MSKRLTDSEELELAKKKYEWLKEMDSTFEGFEYTPSTKGEYPTFEEFHKSLRNGLVFGDYRTEITVYVFFKIYQFHKKYNFSEIVPSAIHQERPELNEQRISQDTKTIDDD